MKARLTIAQQILTRLAAERRDCITVRDMQSEAWADTDKRLHNALDALERRGFAAKTARGCYRVTADGRDWIAAGRQIRSGQGAKPHTQARGLPARAWAWLRIHRKGTVADMLGTIATGAEPSAEHTLRRYLAALAAAGYVQRISRGAGAGRYLLTVDSGRLAPIHRRVQGAVYDPNTGEIHPLQGAAHD